MPRHWVSLVPTGLNQQKPRHYLDMLRVAWDNRDELPYAWRILRDGVCDGCALGTSGLRDWTVPGIHLCMVRLELMRLNTAPALDVRVLRDVDALRGMTSSQLRDLGRLPEPMVRRRGEAGFRVVTWDEALEVAAAGLRDTPPDRMAFYLTSRGITNEVYYAAQKTARCAGTSHIDNSARLCHAASTAAMKAMLGRGASTCSYVDWLGADLIVFFGSNTPNNQPVTTKYLYCARRNGARIAVVNPYREPGLARYWIPSIANSALFGTRLADEWFDVHTGGDLAFLIGVLKALNEANGVDEPYVRERTRGWEQIRDRVSGLDWRALEEESGAPEARMRDFALLLVDRPNAIFVWSMGLTQHAHGVETIRALIDVALARGLPGRQHRGVMPIRGHSGVQGGAEVGCTPSVEAGTLERWERLWGFAVPRSKGYAATEMVAAAASGALDLFWIVGGNFLETLPQPAVVRRALERPRLRIHQDLVPSTSMLVDPADTVLLLPATTRYESPGGGTETTTERRIVFSPEVPGRRIGQARPEWWAMTEAAARAWPERAARIRCADAAAIRAEIAKAVPLYAGIERLRAKGDQVQWGGRVLYADGEFATPDRKAHFMAVSPRGRHRDDGTFLLSTRRGKQFNSMVQREVDPLTGAARDAILMSDADADALSLSTGAALRLRSTFGSFEGRVLRAPIRPGNLEVHWPEGTVLLGPAVDPDSQEPDYNAVVTVEPL
ncbi:MAG: molybdopterin-dependent oxidoreductase [Acidobacteria bacterium]|nr:molybdopterin-dependent oxidoreductase [Acidobacteriota bacterium]